MSRTLLPRNTEKLRRRHAGLLRRRRTQHILATQGGAGSRRLFGAGKSMAPAGRKQRRRSTRISPEAAHRSIRLADPLITYTITERDAAGPFIDAMPTDLMAESNCVRSGIRECSKRWRKNSTAARIS